MLIILFGVAPGAANILEVLPVGSPLPAAVAPTVVTARLPGGGFFTGTTTLLQRKTVTTPRLEIKPVPMMHSRYTKPTM